MHKRSIIRQHFVERLMNNTLAEEKVYNSRLYPLQVGEMPAIIVFANNETVASHAMGVPRSLYRQLQVTVECYALVEDMAIVIVDSITKQVEEIMLSNIYNNSIYQDCTLESTVINLNNELETPVVMAT